MKRLVPAVIIVAALALFGAWWFSPTQVLKRRTHSLLVTLTLDSSKGNVTRQMGAYSLNGLLASEVELDTPTIKEANGTFNRAELESAYSWLCQQAKQTHFKLVAFKSVSINGDSAKVELTLDGLVELPTYRPADGIYDVTFDWRKQEDVWRLARASWQQLEARK
jgi:hypothetical protein